MKATHAYVYIALWATACLVAAALYCHSTKSYALSHTAYWRFLFKPWKLITFLVAATGLTVIAPYSGDPTWDYFNAMFMSALAFLTAPWVTGAIYKTLKRDLPMVQGFLAFCIWMFSASWSHDLYLLIRDGYYPVTWLANLGASSLLYLAAGLFWNLEWSAARGVDFAFTVKEWPTTSAGPTFQRILRPALVFMILVSCMILAFLWAGRR